MGLVEETARSLEAGAAALAEGETPGVRAADLLASLDELASGVWLPPGAPAIEAWARLSVHLFQELGFRGDAEDYDAPQNSLLDRVLERRRGLPILLCIVTRAVAARVGLELTPVAFPGHFLLGARADPSEGGPVSGERFFVDPFDAGRVLPDTLLRARLAQLTGDASGTLYAQIVAPAPARTVMIRVCNNLARSYLLRRNRAGVARLRGHLHDLGAEDPRVLGPLDAYLEGTS